MKNLSLFAFYEIYNPSFTFKLRRNGRIKELLNPFMMFVHNCQYCMLSYSKEKTFTDSMHNIIACLHVIDIVKSHLIFQKPNIW